MARFTFTVMFADGQKLVETVDAEEGMTAAAARLNAQQWLARDATTQVGPWVISSRNVLAVRIDEVGA